MGKHGRIAFITTPRYREAHRDLVEDFVYRHMYSLCGAFKVLSTGRTYEFVHEILSRPLKDVNAKAIAQDTGFPIKTRADLARWRRVIQGALVGLRHGIQGMVEITHELVEGRLDAVIHLTDWDDVVGKPDSMVLRREANVHNVPIASDVDTARSAIANWKGVLAKTQGKGPVFRKRPRPATLPLEGLTTTHRVLALIAHDGMKLPMCCFVVEHAKRIFDGFDYVLATGTTGAWLKRFVLAAGRSQAEADRIRCCLSGPYGGDVQIAAAVVKKICRKVIFLQDPFTSHAHETDIRLFEQAVLLFQRAAVSDDIDVELATNVEGARAILGV